TAPAGPLAGKVPAPRTDVLITVPVFALLGLTDEPAMLDGHGPIPASMARELVADGATSFYRVLVDPRDGTPLEIGRTSYRLTKAMKQALRLRDGRCTFPGCNNHTLDNEADHLTAWQHGGTTGISNLAQLCPKHHRLKHNSAWTPTPATKKEPPGWTSPTGRKYQSEQPDWEPPIGPDKLQDQSRSALRHPQEAGEPDPSTADGWPPQEWLDSAPPYFEPPCEEPAGENLIDPDDIPPDSPIWDEPVWNDFYAMPFVLPQDPDKDWALSGWALLQT
ncbi:HNH endonuclease signature motif containing protein, partial [Arthrobacter sp. RT-1]|uniref:HNH endonuclease signature motif containing protein n=1 Tax=Arthrobacter sp. RT-1 TaxID=2292263 RepID=UPI0021628C4E